MPGTGRFAPTPSGPLHFGSLIAAMGSYLQARHQGGTWLVRIDDTDTHRVMPGAVDDILFILEAYGFEWDDSVTFQSDSFDLYQYHLDRLRDLGALYPCDCTRKQILSTARRTSSGWVYPGTCRNKSSAQFDAQHAWRVRLKPDTVCEFTDLIQGKVRQQLLTEVGDFTLKRRDGLFAYQLAIVVDDHQQSITEVVRGNDLLDNTPRQIYLQELLGFATPGYAHLPIACNANGDKLSKQTFAEALPSDNAIMLLLKAWEFLGQRPFAIQELPATPAEFWKSAEQQWDITLTPKSQPALN